MLVATEDEGVFEVTGYVNTGSLEFGESDYSIHVHDSNPDAYNHIKSLEIAVGDLITFSTDITELEDGSVNVVAKVWRPAE